MHKPTPTTPPAALPADFMDLAAVLIEPHRRPIAPFPGQAPTLNPVLRVVRYLDFYPE